MTRRADFFRRSTAALAVASILVVAGCATTSASQNQAGSKPTSGGTLVFATDREPNSLDAAVGGDQPQSLIARQYLDSLVFQNTDGTFSPWLAKSWEISDDQTTYTFHLRNDVTFSDGTPLTAKSVLANIDYWIDPETRSAEANRSLVYYEGSTIVDDHTITIDLGKPYADFLSSLASSFAGIQSEKGIARGQEVNGQDPIGSGPFVVKEWDQQQQVVLTRRDDYNWAPESAQHQGPAYVDEIVWRFITEPTTRFGALQAGEVQVIEVIPPESFATVESSDNLDLIDGSRPGVPFQLDFNVRRAPFDDVKVRQAVRYGADVEAGLQTIYFGAVKSVGGALSPSTVYADPQFEDVYAHDAAKANALLDEAGWTTRDADGYRTKDGERLVADVNVDFDPQPQEYLLLDHIAGSLQEVGVQLTYEKQTDDITAKRRQDLDYDLTKDYWGGPNTGTALHPIYHSSQIDGSSGYRNNGIGYVDPKLDALIDEAAVVTDSDQRAELYSEAQKIISDQALALPLFLIPLQYAFRTDLVRDVETDPRSSQVWLYDAWLPSN